MEENLLQSYVNITREISKLEKEKSKLREEILDLIHNQSLHNKNKNKFLQGHYVAEIITSIRDTMTKKSVPKDIWERYAKQIAIETLKVNKISSSTSKSNK